MKVVWTTGSVVANANSRKIFVVFLYAPCYAYSMKDKNNQSSQEWEISRWNRESNKWAARKARWNAWKQAQKKVTAK